MKKILTLLFIIPFIFSCKPKAKTLTLEQLEEASKLIARIDTFAMPSSIRAIEVFNNKTVWYAGSRGDYGYTENGGASWKIDSLKFLFPNQEYGTLLHCKPILFDAQGGML